MSFCRRRWDWRGRRAANLSCCADACALRQRCTNVLIVREDPRLCTIVVFLMADGKGREQFVGVDRPGNREGQAVGGGCGVVEVAIGPFFTPKLPSHQVRQGSMTG